MLYNSSGQKQINIVDGSTYTGLYSVDGEYNGVLNDGVSTYTGLYHPCGAYNVTVVANPYSGFYAKNGSMNIMQAPGGYAALGGSFQGKQRIVADTSNSFYVMATNSRGTAFAYHFIRNVGGSAGTDVGTPWQPWRLSGTFEFASINNNPTLDTPIYIWCDDTGAQNYAIQLGAKFAGSYHGGETANTQTVTIDGINTDPTLNSALGSSTKIAHTSTVTDGSNTYTVDFQVIINADGSITSTMNNITSASSFGKWYVGMVIAQQGYDEAWTDFGGPLTGLTYKVPVSVGTQTYGRTYLAQAASVRMRKSTDGREIYVVGNWPSISGYRRTSIVRDTSLNRSKMYFEFNSGVPGTKTNISWTNYYNVGQSGATIFGSNMVTNGDFPVNISNWTTNQNPAGVAWQAPGMLRQTRAAAGTDTRTIQGVNLTGGAPYLMSGEDTFTGALYQDPGSLGLTNNSNGSTSSPAPDYPLVAFDQNGYNGHVVIPTATATRYVMMALPAQAGGTSVGDTSDWDNISLIPLST